MDIILIVFLYVSSYVAGDSKFFFLNLLHTATSLAFNNRYIGLSSTSQIPSLYRIFLNLIDGLDPSILPSEFWMIFTTQF